MDTGANFSSVTDYAQNSQTTGFGGNVGLSVPVASFVKVYATLIPRYDATTYSQTGNSSANTSLESDPGLIFPLSETFSFRVGAARIDQWSAQSGVSANTDPTVLPYSVTWKGTAGVELKQPVGISASSNYGFGKTVGGPYINSLDANVSWHGQQNDPVKELAAGGSDSVSVDDSGAVVDNRASWKASVQFGDQGALAGGATYVGSADGISQVSLTNTAHANISHQVTPEISYALAADLSNSLGPDIQSTLIQSSQAKLTVAPRFGDRVVTFTADDILALDLEASPNTIVSKAGPGSRCPCSPSCHPATALTGNGTVSPFRGCRRGQQLSQCPGPDAERPRCPVHAFHRVRPVFRFSRASPRRHPVPERRPLERVRAARVPGRGRVRFERGPRISLPGVVERLV